MEKKELICIGCPMGCALTAETDGVRVENVQGNTCKRGKIYAEKELTNPTRIVTSTVRVEGSTQVHQVPVKTESDIPKGKIFECVYALKDITVAAPVHIGDVILENVAGTGVNIIASGNA
ncbi:MAG: DUF1667 domain-containing protein [Eubacteriales bacterium]|nr:DUF1667 domain-containing protein [Eubacteriales bacterium]